MAKTLKQPITINSELAFPMGGPERRGTARVERRGDVIPSFGVAIGTTKEKELS